MLRIKKFNCLSVCEVLQLRMYKNINIRHKRTCFMFKVKDTKTGGRAECMWPVDPGLDITTEVVMVLDICDEF